MPVLPDFQPGNAAYGRSADALFQGIDQGQSMMARAQALRLREQQNQREQAEFVAKLPLIQAQTQLTQSNAAAAVENATRQTQLQTQAASASVAYQNEFNDIIKIPDWEEKSAALEGFQAKVAWLGDLKDSGYSGFVDAVGKARVQAEGMLLSNRRLSMASREFELLTQGMTPEEVEKARRIKLGLNGRASGAAITYHKVTGPDGREQFVAVDPRAVGAQVIGSGETYGSGVSQTPESSAAANGETPVRENRFISQTPYDKNREESEGKKDAEYKAKLRQEKPKREAALNQAEALTDQLTGGIDELIGKVSEATAGPGGVLLGKFPGTTAKDLQVNLDSIKANIGFQALQAMREASPTGGSLGNISDTENKLLQARFGALEIGQSPTQLIENLKKVRQRIIQNYSITRAAFANEYGVDGNEVPAPETAPVKILSIREVK